ncbi:MAG: helix-turn-helix domain-containing protein [Geminicoccaceae bacterium]
MTDDVNILTDAATMSQALGRRLAGLRRERGLSLDRLAQASGVSKGMLVQIEAGRANPSIATLCRAAAGLGVAVAELLEREVAPSRVRIVAPDSGAVLWRGPQGGTARLLVGSTGPDMLELWAWELHPGERHDSEPHPAGTVELLEVHAGTLALVVAGQTHHVPAGGAALAATDRAHAYLCAGGVPVRWTMAVHEPHRRRTGGRPHE